MLMFSVQRSYANINLTRDDVLLGGEFVLGVARGRGSEFGLVKKDVEVAVDSG